MLWLSFLVLRIIYREQFKFEKYGNKKTQNAVQL